MEEEYGKIQKTVKSIYKGGLKESIPEDQRRTFLMNAISKTYESGLKIQNESNNENMTRM